MYNIFINYKIRGLWINFYGLWREFINLKVK